MSTSSFANFQKGKLSFDSTVRYRDSDSDSEEYYELTGDSFYKRKIDKDGAIVDNNELSLRCLESEKQRLSELLSLIGTEITDPTRLMDIGMLYETGLAGIDRNLAKAWECYLKAAQLGDQKAIEFVMEVFSDESRKDLRKLLKNRAVSKEYYPVFFELGRRVNNTKLSAKLLSYKKALEKDEAGLKS